MGEFKFNSMAYYTTNSSSSINGTSLGWDLQNLGVVNADMPLDFSSGYLEDALLEFTERSKRRRLLLYNDDDHGEISGFNDLAMQGCWDYSCNWGLSEDFTCINGVSDQMKTTDAFDSSSSSSCKLSAVKTKSFSSGNEDKTKMKKRVITRVVYPFALVKPGGVEGDTTLNDINERILMPPSRPVRHPVGDFACRPCVSADGPGLSGKDVVALTKIHTQGRGTITIIRTKG
ncbi:uncharacterized protein LOC120197195 isoform X2 [Hibiscus syriacus]|uniref:uncharacterized protein LOC120197195 isoform X2 n=1 Tax=Hibiscus syriacus TaxID=106335 RepID=UPI001920F458|nr:uncharacterized protein LOC120197195 isoform X2 [Hibiscus syriacus]